MKKIKLKMSFPKFLTFKIVATSHHLATSSFDPCIIS